MIRIGNFFFKYRNLLFPLFALSIFVPSPPLFASEYYEVPLFAGLVIAALGQVIRALTIGLRYIVRGRKNGEVYAENLVTEGIFHHSRNPLYAGNILMLSGAGLLSNSLLFLVFAVPLFSFIYHAIVLAEEHYLEKMFEQQYEQYKSGVNRWIPDFRGLGDTLSSMKFNWRRYIVKEYNTLYLLLLSIPIVWLTHDPRVTGWPFEKKMNLLLMIFGALSAVYVVVRYLKKSRKLNPEPDSSIST